jgi:hypothetical protein
MVAQAIEHVWPGNGDFTLESYPQIAALFCAGKGKRELRSVAFYAAMGSGGGEKKQIRLLHDIFGNPFRPVVWNPSWRSSSVLALAQAAHEHRHLPAGTLEPDRLAVLADALEDAGCTEPELLDQLRSNGPHVRGCWAVDFVMGRS